MRTVYKIIGLILLAVALLIVSAAATPSGTSVSLVSNNNATFTASGFAASGGWFEYGMTPATLNVWTTQQPGGGSITWTEQGSPLTSGITYYVAGCDATGCDPNPAQFTMGNATVLPATTFGYLITNATANKFNPLMFVSNVFLPYAWLFPATAQELGIAIMTALILFAIFWGYAVRTRGVALVTIMAVLTSGYLMYNNQGLNLGIPVEFMGIAQGIFYASIAGILLIILRK